MIKSEAASPQFAGARSAQLTDNEGDTEKFVTIDPAVAEDKNEIQRVSTPFDDEAQSLERTKTSPIQIQAICQELCSKDPVNVTAVTFKAHAMTNLDFLEEWQFS